ncbi:MAG: hypothetical protein ACOC0N_02865 [Chroococcales cyanobacterium]
MKSIREINPLLSGRKPPSKQQRKAMLLKQKQQAKERGYQELAELCYLGEYETAKSLAKRHPEWSYEIVNGEVKERGEHELQ